ncbi:MAG: endopeptidase La [Candidatus Marinimicrobia bacterium]|nr:endopeptidase La [Candidatus Neomarinimicrobiota bacterium]
MNILKNYQHNNQIPNTLKILQIEGSVAFPHIIFPILIHDEAHLQLVNDALNEDKHVAIFSKKIIGGKKSNLYKVGVACTILKLFKNSDGSTRILLRGDHRIEIVNYLKTNKKYKVAKIKFLNDLYGNKLKSEAIIRTISDLFHQIITISPIFPEEIEDVIFAIEDSSKLADLIISALNIRVAGKQDLLDELDVNKRLLKLVRILKKEYDLIKLNTKIHNKVNSAMTKDQRENFLRHQLATIQEELGESDRANPDVELIRKKIKKTKLTAEAKEVVEKEIERLEKQHPSSPDYTVILNYLEWITALPWEKFTKKKINIAKAEKILNKYHYGLNDIKDRFLEFLSVQKLKPDAKSPILCLVGAPGVGKTSLGESVAKAMGRKFIRFSVGGMHDEAEIRGHRKTYIGAMPGRIIQYLKKIKVSNPVIMIDEVDKIGQDFRGDPSSALLEVLDPEQNNDFRDNYLEVAFDLSKVTFIATANTIDPIPSALRDRMEKITLPGYINPEKVQIAKKFLIPRQIKGNGLSRKNLKFTDSAIDEIISNYTMEAGVRSLERNISKICRKVAREFASNQDKLKVSLSTKNLVKYLGPKKIFREDIPQKDEIGIVTGLAYTASGGEVLPVEANIMQGKGIFKMTGQLGDVMKESISTSISYLRANAKKYDIDEKIFKEHDIHLHFPAAAIPKDGPSAGVSITTAIVSILKNKKVNHNLAMTGEISLRGRILPIGGLREKITAAKRAKIKKVILPEANKNDLSEVPDNVKEGIEFIFVKQIDEVLKEAILD